jgi:hypothetical protein
MVKQKTTKKNYNPKMIKTRNNLATLVYTKAIEDRVKSKYLKRIDYLVEANNELMNELEQCESEIITVEKECYGRGSV